MSLPAPSVLSPLPPTPVTSPTITGQDDAALLSAAKALEAGFLSEMLKHGGLGATPEDFGGGVGEDQFAGMMAQLRAEQMVEAGGIGLAEHIFEALKTRALG